MSIETFFRSLNGASAEKDAQLHALGRLREQPEAIRAADKKADWGPWA